MYLAAVGTRPRYQRRVRTRFLGDDSSGGSSTLLSDAQGNVISIPAFGPAGAPFIAPVGPAGPPIIAPVPFPSGGPTQPWYEYLNPFAKNWDPLSYGTRVVAASSLPESVKQFITGQPTAVINATVPQPNVLAFSPADIIKNVVPAGMSLGTAALFLLLGIGGVIWIVKRR